MDRLKARLGIGWIQLDGAVVAIQRFFDQTHAVQRETQVAPGFHMPRIGVEGPAIAGHRRFDLAFIQVDIAQVVMGIRIVGIDLQGALVTFHGCFHVAPVFLHHAEIVENHGEVAMISYHFRIGVGRLFQFAVLLVGQSEIGQGGRHGRIDAQCRKIGLDGLWKRSKLMVGGCQQEMRVGPLRRCRDHFLE